MRLFSLSIIATIALSIAAPAEARADDGYRLVWDDFKRGFSANTPDAKWLNFTVARSADDPDPFVADDGVVSTSARGLRVASVIDPVSGHPAFTKTMPQSDPLSTFDRVKWLAIMNHTSSKGYVGFDAVEGQELACEAVISGRIYGVHDQPFGDAIPDPEADLRLGAVATSAFDPETFTIFNFLLTNEVIYAFYERAPFLRAALGDYASFIFAVPVAVRSPGDEHRLRIAYDKRGGVVRWIVDGVEVYRVTRIGSRIDRQTMLVDRGGEDVIVSPDQLDCGMGMFTFLDAMGPWGVGLVQLDAEADSYFDPRFGAPAPMSFLDPFSLPYHRLFGQGAEMKVQRFIVSSRRVR